MSTVQVTNLDGGVASVKLEVDPVGVQGQKGDKGDPGELTEAQADDLYSPKLTVVGASSDYTASANEFVNAGSVTVDITVTLPTSPPTGSQVRVKNTGPKLVTIAGGGGALVDGLASRLVPDQYSTVHVQFMGTNWVRLNHLVPNIYNQRQIDTATTPAGGNTNFCFVVANQITTGSAADGVHDLVFVAQRNPSIGDADIYFERGGEGVNENTSGVLFMHIPIKSATGFEIRDANNVVSLSFAQTGAVVNVHGTLKGAAGANGDMFLQPGSSSGTIRFRNSSGTARLTYAETGDAFTFAHGATWAFGVTSGQPSTWQVDGTDRLAVRAPAGGIRFLNNAFTAQNLFLADNGDLTPRDGANLILNATTGMKFGTAATQKLAFYGATPIVRPSGVAVSAAGIHAALVSLGLIAA